MLTDGLVAVPADYKLSKPGTVGRPVGPYVKIINSSGFKCRVGEEGEIVLKGGMVMNGYAEAVPQSTGFHSIVCWCYFPPGVLRQSGLENQMGGDAKSMPATPAPTHCWPMALKVSGNATHRMPMRAMLRTPAHATASRYARGIPRGWRQCRSA